MDTLVEILVFIIAIEHFGFLYLEMYLWPRPTGQKVFKLSESFAKESAPLAANQGLYNGFLATGLLFALFLYETPEERSKWVSLFLVFVIVAGLFGWKTVSKTIFYLQALPAIFALGLVYIYF
ncbi:MAG: DUF1304 domain-containing protein [Bdellovibrionales bacterium]